ncbi:hypothetical protein TcBrA4_0038660 [Trypanosoma cruzi]|nr:hypothetical protein TcBrA4_0038660 [Trypanosoma cruzi]
MTWVGSCVLWSRRRRRWSRAWTGRLRAGARERRLKLQEHTPCRATSDDLGRQLRAVEQAKTEVEQSLEAVTTERDELREHLAATSDDLGKAAACCGAGEDRRWSRAWRQ